MKWGTGYWGMEIEAENAEEGKFLKSWYLSMKEKLSEPAKWGGYDGDDEYGMMYYEPDESDEFGWVLITVEKTK